MARKLFVSVFVVIATVGLLAGATYAWFTAESEEFTNEFTAGTVEIEADEEVNTKGFDENNWNPGDEAEKEFTIINKGTKGIRLRGIFEAKWYEKVGDQWVEWTPQGDDAMEITFEAGGMWTQDPQNPNIWYYNERISGTYETEDEAARTAKLTVKVKLDGPKAGNQYQGKKFVLTAKFQAIQASHSDEWDWDEFDTYHNQ
ncbi:MAG TPA: hypothetical protein GXZ32_05955 [Clostridiales bacterium]|jgi:predicted ribosomally synthesized peptide with SipW-like signal peptide|nr:hypothetical protein [Clostridiales bacterium]